MTVSSLLSSSITGRSGRPRPLSSSSIVALLGGAGYLRTRFFHATGGSGSRVGGRDDYRPSGGGVREEGEGGNAGTEGGEDAPGIINLVGAKRSHSNGNNNDEIEKICQHYLQPVLNALAQNENNQTVLLAQFVNSQTMTKNLLAQIANSQTMTTDLLAQIANSQTITNLLAQIVNTSIAPVVARSPIDDDAVNKIKGLLGFIYTLVCTVFFFYSALVTFSVTYPGSAKALVNFDNTWTKCICFINLVSWFGGVVMLPFASRFKDGESTDDKDGFGIFIWALYLWLLLLIPEYFTTVHVFLHTWNWIVWPFGTALFCVTVLPSVVYIESQRPTLVSKCAKYMWEKIKSCCPTSQAPSRATGLDRVNSDTVQMSQVHRATA